MLKIQDTIVYKVGRGLYVNLTNRCPCDCSFCIRNAGDGINSGESLWLVKEPTYHELTLAIDNAGPEDYDECVFCGYGEPTECLELLIKIADYIKRKYPNVSVRLNTNGLSDLINGRKTAKELSTVIDSVSVSLNAPCKEDYTKLCRPAFGEKSYAAMLEFAADCKQYFKDTCLTVVNVIGEQKISQCERIAGEMGIRFRVR